MPRVSSNEGDCRNAIDDGLADLSYKRTLATVCSHWCELLGFIMVKHGRSYAKRHGCLFSCLSFRSIHLEVLQYTTQRVYSKRDLFETLTSMNIARDHHNRIIHYCKYGILVFDHDGTGPADESKRTKRVQGWSRQIVGGGLFIICNTITL